MNIENLFNERVGHRMYSSTMSLNRFKFIKRMITFDDSKTRNDRWKKDKISAFRKVFEMFNKQCARNYFTDDFLAIDETLYPIRGSIGFKAYNKVGGTFTLVKRIVEGYKQNGYPLRCSNISVD